METPLLLWIFRRWPITTTSPARSSRLPSFPTNGPIATAVSSSIHPDGFTAWFRAVHMCVPIMSSACRWRIRPRSPASRSNEPAESIGGLYPSLVRDNPGHVRAFLCRAEFWDVGTPADYLQACLAIGKSEDKANPQIGARSFVDPSARVSDAVIWDDVAILGGAAVERCIVADGVTIPAGARFRNCAIIQRDGKLVAADLT